MRHANLAGTPFIDLVRDLPKDVKALFREELQLAKRELAEKAAGYARNGIGLVIGAVLAFAGFIALVIGIGVLLGYAFRTLGLDPLLATFIGLGLTGLALCLIGGVFMMNGIKVISPEKLTPHRTIATLKHEHGGEPSEPTGTSPSTTSSEESSAELQERPLSTQDRIGEKLEEIGYRISPAGIRDRTAENMRKNPYKWGLIALGSGLVSSFYVTGKLKRESWATRDGGWRIKSKSAH